MSRPRRWAMFAATLALAACGLNTVGIGGDVAPPPDAAASVVNTGPVGDSAVTSSDAGSGVGVPDANADAAPATCKSDEINALGRCFFIEDSDMTQSDAKASCAKRGAHLVTVPSQEKETWFMSAANDKDRWLGLEAASNPDNKREYFHWVTGESTADFQHWYSGDPNDMGLCVIIIAGDPEWADRSCSEKHPSVCERSL